MKDKNIEKLIKTIDIDTNPVIDKKVLDEVLDAHQAAQKTKPLVQPGTLRRVINIKLIKFAAAAVVLLATGYITGRLSAPKQADVEEIKRTLEGSLNSSLAATRIQIQNDLYGQLRRDLTESTAQTLAAMQAQTNQHFMKLAELIEAARIQDRRRITAALEQIEINRRQDRDQLGNGLVTLAAQTNQLLRNRQEN